MTTEVVYRVSEAAADLQAAGLLSGGFLPDGGRLAPCSVAEAASPAGTFRGAVLDSRQVTAGTTSTQRLFVALAGEHRDGRDFVPEVVVGGGWVLTRAWDAASPDPLLAAPAGADGGVLLSADPVAALAQLARCWRARHDALTVLGVTGSNGKTTTKDLLRAALSAVGPVCATSGNLNNHLGVPLTLLDLQPHHRSAVIEMGASAVGDIAHLAGLAGPQLGIITNAAPAHLADFGSLERVIMGKGELLDALPAAGTAVLNADSPGFDAWCERAPCPVVTYGRTAGDHRWAWRAAGASGGPEITLDGEAWPVPLPGAHNGANLTAAVLAARAAGVDDPAIRRGLASFAGSDHRGALLHLGGRTLLDDAYNANPESMLAAARALLALAGAGSAVAVLGHMAELGPDSAQLHRETGRQLAQLPLAALIVVGEQARFLGEGFDAAGGAGHYCATLDEAARLAAELTHPGDRVLIKGSRSAGLERLLPLLAIAFAAD